MKILSYKKALLQFYWQLFFPLVFREIMYLLIDGVLDLMKSSITQCAKCYIIKERRMLWSKQEIISPKQGRFIALSKS